MLLTLDWLAGNFSIIWRPIVPVGWCFFLALLAAVAAVYAYWRAPGAGTWARSFLLWLRLFVIAIVLAILLGPSREMEVEQAAQEGSLIVMVDASQSMSIADMNGKGRLEALKQTWLSPASIQRMRSLSKVSLYSFAERAYPQYLPRQNEVELPILEGQSTYLVQSVSEVVQGMPYRKSNQRLLLLSDGIDSEDASLERLVSSAKARGVAVFTVAVGSDVATCDTSIVAVPLQESLYPRETGGIRVRYVQAGANHRNTTLRVRVNEKTEEYPIQFSDRGLGELTIPIQQETAGTFRYDLSLEPLAEETEWSNNEATVFVPVMPQRIRVLLLEGQPYWDTKFVAEALRKDERVELTQISQIGESKVETIVTRRQDAGGVTIPLLLEEWAAYDVVILGKEIQRLLNSEAAANLAEHVLTGNGNVIFARGNAASASSERGVAVVEQLERIEPVQWLENSVGIKNLEPTVDGRLAPWLTIESLGVDFGRAITELRPWISVEQTQSVKGAARILLHAKDASGQLHPAVVIGPVGEGLAVTIAGEGSWRWSLYPPASPQLAGFYDMFWANLLRYVVLGSDFEPGQQLAMSLSENAVRMGDELIVDVRLKQDVANMPPMLLELGGENGSVETLPLVRMPGRAPRYQAKWSATREGIYEVTLRAAGMTPETISKNFSVYSLNLERLDTVYRPAFLEQLAQRTQGQAYTVDQCENFLDELKLDIEQQYLPPQVEYFWGQMWILLLLLFAAGCEWIVRRQCNLI